MKGLLLDFYFSFNFIKKPVFNRITLDYAW